MSLAILGVIGFAGAYFMQGASVLAKVGWACFILMVMLFDWGDGRVIRELEEENASLREELADAWDDLARETHADNER